LPNTSTLGQREAKSVPIAPAHVGTSVGDAELKLHYLRAALQDGTAEHERQRKNIEFPIDFYEQGRKLPEGGKSIWLLDGKIVDKMPKVVPKGSAKQCGRNLFVFFNPNLILFYIADFRSRA
jgi:hypothetical protein